jgi:hypothetical protein
MMFQDYRKVKPPEEGWYIWRLPHRHFDAVIVFLARYRLRGAGHQQVLSPEFDHWNGRRVILPEGSIEWDYYDGEPPSYGNEVIEVVGVELMPCPFCGEVPKWQYSGKWVLSGPTITEFWYTKCCSWAKSPHYVNPIVLNERRNEALLSHAGVQ